jgi:hypothetical protein
MSFLPMDYNRGALSDICLHKEECTVEFGREVMRISCDFQRELTEILA